MREKAKKYAGLGSANALWGITAQKAEEEKKKKEKLAEIKSTNITSTSLVNAVSFDGLPKDSILNSFIESHKLMSEKFYENATFIKEVALEKLTALRKELENEVNVMSMMGDATIFELEKAEDDVQKAWGE